MFEQINLILIINSLLLGVGLAMDAFSVSIVNGLKEPKMKPARMSLIAGCYALFQFAMPMIGWFLVHSLIGVFKGIEPFVPWVALLLLLFIGGKMLIESIRDIRESRKRKGSKDCKDSNDPGYGPDSDDGFNTGYGSDSKAKISVAVLFVQGLATSIDALSVGFTIAEYTTFTALLSSLIIAAITFMICMVGLKIGKLVGNRLGVYAGLLGGTILIGIGIEIFVKGVFF